MGRAGAVEPEIFPSPKRVRAVLGGRVVADSRRTLLLRPGDGPPTCFFPWPDVASGALTESGRVEAGRYGETRSFHVQAGGLQRRAGAWSLWAPTAQVAGLAGHVALAWDAMDAWFEEDEEVFVHPRDPRVRVDTAISSVHVTVRAGGEPVAESRRPTLLFETGLPTRYYLPNPDVRMELLEPSETATRCPYKGEAGYYSLRLGGRRLQDAAWYYRYPRPEACGIAGLLCFYPETVTLEVEEAGT